MRDYRGIRGDNGEWVYGWYSHRKHLAIAIDGEISFSVITDRKTLEWHSVIPSTIGQAIGKQDRNGIEIYSGDVAVYDHDGLNKKGIIKFNQKYLYWEFEYKTKDVNGKTRTETYDFIETQADEYQVIGTIHTPEGSKG